MAVDSSQHSVSSDVFPAPGARTLFAHEARRDGKVVARLFGVERDEHTIGVAAEIFPVTLLRNNEPQWRFYDFPTIDQARRFADEALIALEYLGCSVGEPAGEV